MFGIVSFTFAITCLGAVDGAAADAVHARTIIVPEQSFAHPSATACFERLFALGGFGQLETERAAFLVRRGGAFDCVVWPASFTPRREQWSGEIPDGTAAIAHTHPNGHPEPSFADQQLAITWGIPVFVITRDGVRRAGARIHAHERTVRGKAE